MLSFAHRLALPLALLALPACPVSEKVGDNPVDTTTDGTTSDPGATGTTSPDLTSSTDSTDGEPATTGTTGPSDPSDTTAADTETEDQGLADFEAMEACDIADVCPAWSQRFAESDPENESPARLCVWAGLSAGTVGRYRYLTEHEFGNGNDKGTTLIHVHADRKATFVQHNVGYLENGELEQEPYEDYVAATTCTLLAPEFFDGCPTSDPFTNEGCYWLTGPFEQGSPWVTDCVAQGPVCE